jgi:hypothetical protein
MHTSVGLLLALAATANAYVAPGAMPLTGVRSVACPSRVHHCAAARVPRSCMLARALQEPLGSTAPETMLRCPRGQHGARRRDRHRCERVHPERAAPGRCGLQGRHMQTRTRPRAAVLVVARCCNVIRALVILQAAVSNKGRMSVRSPVSSAASMAPMGLRSSSFAPTSFTVRSETELQATLNGITMALKPGQKPVVIGELCAGAVILSALPQLRLAPLPELQMIVYSVLATCAPWWLMHLQHAQASPPTLAAASPPSCAA